MTDLEILLRAGDVAKRSGWIASGDEIKEAATRMAERIKDLEETVEFGQKNYDRLKSELAAAKPVICGECKKHETQECRMANWDEVYMQYTTGCVETDFCSKAVRKESKTV